MVIDVIVHRINPVRLNLLCPYVRFYRRIRVNNVSMEHVNKANVHVFLVGQVIGVQMILMNVKVNHVQIKEHVM